MPMHGKHPMSAADVETIEIHGFSGGVFSVIEIDQFTCSLASGQITLIALMPCKLDCIDFIGVVDP